MAVGWTQGAACDLMREHIGLNLTSFSATALTDSADLQWDGIITVTPARGTHAADSTAYGTQPTATSWNHQLRLRPLAGGQLT